MTDKDYDYSIPAEQWPELLTDNLREHFNRLGEEIVRHAVTNHHYGKPEKHYAALHWLDQVRRGKERRDKILLRVAVTTLVVAVVGTIASLA